MIRDIGRSDTCKQGRRHTQSVQTAVYHTSLETRTSSAFTVSHSSLSLSATYQQEQLIQNSSQKQLLCTDITFLIGISLTFRTKMCLVFVCVDVLASH